MLAQREKTITELAQRFEKNATHMEAELKAQGWDGLKSGS